MDRLEYGAQRLQQLSECGPGACRGINDCGRDSPYIVHYPLCYDFTEGTWFISDPVTGQQSDGASPPYGNTDNGAEKTGSLKSFLWKEKGHPLCKRLSMQNSTRILTAVRGDSGNW